MLHFDEDSAIWVQDKMKMSFGFVRLWRHRVADFGVAQLCVRRFTR